MPQPPLLRVSSLDGRVYLLTHYRLEVPADPKEAFTVTAKRRRDVTEQFEQAVLAWQKYRSLQTRRRRKAAARA